MDQLLTRRQGRQRGHAVAAQAAIMAAQATRSAEAVSSAISRSGERAVASADRLDDAVQQIQSAAAPLLHLLSPATRDSIQRLGQTAED